MSSAKKPMLNESPRPLRLLKNSVVPFSEFWQALRHFAGESAAQRRALEKTQDGLVVALSEKIDDLRRVTQMEKNRAENRLPEEFLARLESLSSGFQEALRPFGYRLETFDGRRWSEISETEAEMEGYVESPDLAESHVGETLRPGVRRGDKTIQRAKVMVHGPSRK